jgi:hypothetical protein
LARSPDARAAPAARAPDRADGLPVLEAAAVDEPLFVVPVRVAVCFAVARFAVACFAAVFFVAALVVAVFFAAARVAAVFGVPVPDVDEAISRSSLQPTRG